MKFSCSIPTHIPLWTQVHQRLSTAFERLGYDFTMEHLPGNRSIAMVNSGKMDGECARWEQAIKISGAQNLLLVKAPIGHDSIVIWGNKEEPGFAHKQLSTSKSKVAVRRGFLLIHHFAKENDIQLTPVNSVGQGFKMLSAGRVDYLIEVGMLVDASAASLGVDKGPSVFPLEVLFRMDAYPVLNKKHKPLLQELSRAISSLPEFETSQAAKDTKKNSH